MLPTILSFTEKQSAAIIFYFNIAVMASNDAWVIPHPF